MAYKIDLSLLDGVEAVTETVAVKDLEIDPRIQRPLDTNKVRKIYREFTPAGVGVLAVSERKNPRQLIVLDGQHRDAVLKKKLTEGGPAEIEAKVYRNLTRAQEAMLFLTLNNTTKPRATDKYRVAVEAGEPVAVAVDELLRVYGLKVSTFPADGNVSAVETLRRVWIRSEDRKWEPNLLQSTIITITKSWGLNTYGLKGMIIEAIAAMYDQYGDLLNMGDFIDGLREENPKTIVIEALQYARSRGRTPPMATAEILVDVYNKSHRGSRRLGEWRRRKW